MNKKYQGFTLALCLSLIVAPVFSKGPKAASTKQVTEEDKLYVQCLQEKGITMYGTSWCPHCKEQKREFGELFNTLNYVDCDQQASLCREKKVTGYPTWLLPSGKEIDPGSIKEVAESSGCSLASLKQAEQAKASSNSSSEETQTTSTYTNTNTGSNKELVIPQDQGIEPTTATTNTSGTSSTATTDAEATTKNSNTSTASTKKNSTVKQVKSTKKAQPATTTKSTKTTNKQ